MNTRTQLQAKAAAPLAFTPVQTGLLQRKCACGGTPALTGECADCTKKHLTMQRRSASQREVSTIPSIVHEVLRSSGQPLGLAARTFMEPRFGHDFSQVRVHADTRAAESAQAVNALAYTVGRDVVFEAGLYALETNAGRRLLAHELAHVVQQTRESSAIQSLSFYTGQAEQEADEAAEQVVAGRFSPVSVHPALGLQRKMKVDKAKDKIPNPGGKGVDQNNAETIRDYLATLCSDGSPKVDASTGDVSIEASFCSEPGFQIGHEGLPAGPAPASVSKTSTGCTCLCDMAHSNHLWTIKVDDSSGPQTTFDDEDAATGDKPGGTGGTVTTISPNSPKVFGAATVSGKKLDVDPWLLLGHELCGHGWLGDSGKSESKKMTETVGRQPLAVDRENALRAEHAIEARGRSFKDPFCGESFTRAKSAKPGTEAFDAERLKTCKKARARCKKPDGSSFKIDEAIPETASCT